MRAQQFPEDGGPLAHNVRPDAYYEINNFYTATVYEKGAEIIRMLKVLIGAEAFRAGMDLYFARYDGTAATVEQFISCFAEVSGCDLTQFFRWYIQAGTPLLEVEAHYDQAAQALTLDIKQSCKKTPGQDEKLAFLIPIEMGLLGRDGKIFDLVTGPQDGASEREIATGVIELAEPQRRITFYALPERPVVSLLRGFSAPISLCYAASEDDLIAQTAHDSDSFNRWQASQTYATRLLLRSVERIRTGGPARIRSALHRRLAACAENERGRSRFCRASHQPAGRSRYRPRNRHQCRPGRDLRRPQGAARGDRRPPRRRIARALCVAGRSGRLFARRRRRRATRPAQCRARSLRRRPMPRAGAGRRRNSRARAS